MTGLVGLFGGGGGASSPVPGIEWNLFRYFLRNNAGTLEHAVARTEVLLTRGFNTFTSSFAAVATGADASTAFTDGAKISTALTNAIIFDTAELDGVPVLGVPMQASIAFNNTGTILNANTAIIDRNVNGVTIGRLEIQLNQDTGAGFPINTTNIAIGEQIEIEVAGLMPNFA